MNIKYFVIPMLVIAVGCSRAKKINLTGDSSKITIKNSTVDRDSITKANKQPNISAEWLIVPGKSIGATHLNEDLDSVFARLGRSDRGDAAMGASFNTWFAKHDTAGYQTDVYAHHNYDGKHDAISYVKIIRVTSPIFKTADGLNVGTSFQDVNNHFKLSHVATYVKGKDSLKIFDDKKAGIAFEISNANKCKGILVHLPGDSEMGYLSLYPDWQRVNLKK